ncbi:MAG TPA: M14 family zinc carboxypeptidase, partial [Ideonella sp.]|nr:M14 family zinc carboxypeptidase [Ideonella sp.]
AAAQVAASPAANRATHPAASPATPPVSPAQPPAASDLAGWCKALGERLAALPLNQCLGTGLLAGEGRSVQGVALWSRDIVPAQGPARLRVLVLGGIHGDEITSVSLVFDWIERALKTTGEPIHWRMVPLVNPDGLLRKPSTRVNSRGVDLNRNFSTMDWASDAQNYWVGRTGKDPRRYPGNKAMSEPETQWVQQQVEQFRPNLIVSVHAPYGLLDFDGPPPVPDKLGSLYLDQIGVYPGSLGNYAGVVRQVPVVTLELKNARTVSVNEVGAMWSDLRGWIDRRLINVAQQGGPANKLR